ncbi:MAG TPA: metal ABC transporter substrate-binding protein [Candidatus Acidoferrum sp.]|nr:metal ABC transporter substrate-binding protein [Candidatus Acidoferrum sp.]
MKIKLILFALLAFAGIAQAKLNVVTTLTDFASIAEQIGGDKIKVSAIAKGSEDPHFIDAKPSFIRLLNQADVLIEGGAELEIGWLPPLLNNARNAKILPGAKGHLFLGQHVKLIDLPTAPVDRSQGDVHPSGNPHFWLDPENARAIATAITELLTCNDNANAAAYETNRKRFVDQLDKKIGEWKKTLEPYRGTKVVTYHKSFDYLLNRFGLELVSTIEPKPGIEPSATHIRTLVPRMKEAQVKLVLAETFRSKRTPEYLAKETGARALFLPSSVGAVPQAKDYFSLLDYDVSQIVSAIKAQQ